MFVFDTTKIKFSDSKGYENDLLVPFQVIADTFLRCAVCGFNGFDYYVGIDATSDQLAHRHLRHGPCKILKGLH